jgi:AcrR family transcriptional regulator
VTTDIRPLRADARRNLERILDSARTLFAERGPAAQMEDIAEHAGVGIGTLYRRFPTKAALVTELVRERFAQFGVVAAECESIEGPYDALATMMRRHAESVQDDVAFRLAMLNLNDFEWEGIEDDKSALNEIVERIISRAQDAGDVRADLRVDDYGLMMCGVVATMHYRSSRGDEWRRHLELVLSGLKPA